MRELPAQDVDRDSSRKKIETQQNETRVAITGSRITADAIAEPGPRIEKNLTARG